MYSIQGIVSSTLYSIHYTVQCTVYSAVTLRVQWVALKYRSDQSDHWLSTVTAVSPVGEAYGGLDSVKGTVSSCSVLVFQPVLEQTLVGTIFI